MYFDKLMEKVRKDKAELAEIYKTDVSSVVYIGNNKYIVVKQDGTEVRV